MESKHLLAPASALTYILSGKGTATIVGKTTRYTFKFNIPAGDSKKPRDRIFVSLLTGANNENDYHYIGFIAGTATFPELAAGRKGNGAHPAFRALAWYLRQLGKPNHGAAEQAEFYHEGVCGRCGRKLTVPESIEQGIGPECIKKI